MRFTVKQIVWLKVLLHLAGFLPLVWLFWAGHQGYLSADPAKDIQHFTGRMALKFLLATLLVSPLARYAKQPLLIRVRRLLGLWCFAWATLHLTSYTLLELGINNLALLGAVQTRTFGKGIVVSGFEHPSVQRPLERLAKQGYDVTVVAPRADGTLDIDAMLERVDKNTILVACMMVNNEIGTRNDVERLAAEVKRRNSRAIVHVDAVQAWMRVPIKLDNIDTLSVSGHKIHAPKGIGALYLSDRLVQAFQPPYLGGEQERQMRPGTENLPYAMGLAAAATRLAKTMKSRDTAMRALNRQLREGLKAFPEVVINSPENAVPEVLNFSENCIKSETMLAFLAEEQIYVSSASACGRGQPSHTLAAMGRDPLAIDTAIRVSFCADNTPEDVDAFLNRFEDGMKHLQKIRK